MCIEGNLEELQLLAKVLIEDSMWLDSFQFTGLTSCSGEGGAKTCPDSRSTIDIQHIDKGSSSFAWSADQPGLPRLSSTPEYRGASLDENCHSLLLSDQAKNVTTSSTRNGLTAKNIALLQRAASCAITNRTGGVRHDVTFKNVRPTLACKSPRRSGHIPIEMLVD
jgi:hypothetical protein